ncbi:Ppx/GppA phosphatase family-domain-containing protein [Lipomyces oligophaga]|uniref:Ppx/GppA phosphatase family-domain-containing protein n=1 Tax=Lipomyces oligophaga TaxID=45792 RepID=UPI0034CDC1FC
MYIGIVDVGSNGVRFSITDISSSPASRNLPVVYQDRAKISLYDALTTSKNKQIPDQVIFRLKIALERFSITCQALEVAAKNVTVFASEAARLASNSSELMKMISKVNPLWKVTLLTAKMEAVYGSMGIAASYYEINGITMDLGGGSIQISWVSTVGGNIVQCDNPVSLPYGAAVLFQRSQSQSLTDLKAELSAALVVALRKIRLPFSLKSASLYLSGGGFRGLGAFAMSTLSGSELYPIPIINGYRCSLKDLDKITQVKVTNQMLDKLEDIFRVSKRRASQLPGVFLLTQALANAAPAIGSVFFAQGGMKEGYIYSTLESAVKYQDPLRSCTMTYARPASMKIQELLDSAMSSFTPIYIRNRIVPAIANLAYAQASFSKDTQATAALNLAIVGPLAGTFGLSHLDRAMIGIILCERWGGEVFDEQLLARLCDLVVAEAIGDEGYAYIFWGYFISRLTLILTELYPAGIVDDEHRIKITVLKDELNSILLELEFKQNDQCRLAIWDRVQNLEKIMKKFKKKYGISRVPQLTIRIVLL